VSTNAKTDAFSGRSCGFCGLKNPFLDESRSSFSHVFVSGRAMPSGRERRAEQQRARREAFYEKYDENSPEDDERRAKAKAQLHKTRIARNVRA